MCIIIDTNSFASVFNQKSSDHDQFQPIKNWIYNGSGRIVYGGTKYLLELKQSGKYLKVFVELGNIRKATILDKEQVDKREFDIKEKNTNSDFNDTHIVAIVIISGCRIVCTKDSRSYVFLKDKRFYPKNFKVPKIYRGKDNVHLISNNSIKSNCAICKNRELS
jgi:predicted nucleic acid-binding protein